MKEYPIMLRQLSAITLAVIFMAGCQMTPPSSKSPTKIPEKNQEQPKGQTTPDGIKITPYDRPEIQREKIIIPTQQSKQRFDDGRNLPAYQQLIKNTHNAFKQAKWDEAEKNALNAQRLAPQSPEAFMYLAMIANHKNQAKNAESLARRGLSYAQTDAMKRQLWMVILKSGQLQKKAELIQEAQNKLKSY